MKLPTSILHNLRFLTAEVSAQVAHLRSFFQRSTATSTRRILDRSGYVHNLKTRIQDECLSQSVLGKGERLDLLSLRAVESVAGDLERLAEHCREVLTQIGYTRGRRGLKYKAYLPLFDLIHDGITFIDQVIASRDTRQALKIGRIQRELANACGKLRERYSRALRRKRHTEDLICALFVAHSVERMGDLLLSISEAIISANLGKPVDTESYHVLKASVELLLEDHNFSDLQIEPIAATRSGSAISGISRVHGGRGNGYVAIYKDGGKRKLKEERAGVESWHAIYPGLAPKILSYKKRGESASLLIEHLPGLTYQQILLHESWPLLRQAANQLNQTLLSVWRETRQNQQVSAGYMSQLASRLDDVFRIHPEFRQSDSRINGLNIPSFTTLQQAAVIFEKRLQAPFSVYIHGDFNVDNIIYDPLEQRINFIDLHRSRYMDYVQDVSVFMVSCYRLQVLDSRIRRRIMDVAIKCCRFTREFARQSGDSGFELRLALALARSFMSSTRFILDKTLAGGMYLRARYLLERVLDVDPTKAASFQVAAEELFNG